MATSSIATRCPHPGSASTRAVTSASRPSGEHNHIPGLEVRSRVLEQAEIVAGHVVEAVGRHPCESRTSVTRVRHRDGRARARPEAAGSAARGPRPRPSIALGARSLGGSRRARGAGRSRTDVLTMGRLERFLSDLGASCSDAPAHTSPRAVGRTCRVRATPGRREACRVGPMPVRGGTRRHRWKDGLSARGPAMQGKPRPPVPPLRLPLPYRATHSQEAHATTSSKAFDPLGRRVSGDGVRLDNESL
jgi:hypothetical protein